jgi:hypothetical protein
MYGLRPLLLTALIGLAASLGGCVAYPSYPAYPSNQTYGYGSLYYGGGYGGFGGGGWRGDGGRGGWHGDEDGWHEGHGGGWRR